MNQEEIKINKWLSRFFFQIASLIFCKDALIPSVWNFQKVSNVFKLIKMRNAWLEYNVAMISLLLLLSIFICTKVTIQ